MPVLWTWLILLLAYLLGLPTPHLAYSATVIIVAAVAMLLGYPNTDPMEDDDETALLELAAVLTALAFTPVLLAPFAAFTALICFHVEYMDEGTDQ